MNPMVSEILFQASVWVIPVLVAITFHEAAHGWVAHRLGDDTAFRLGRVTFNPFRHIDTFGTILLPALLLVLSGGRMMFGYAKPVPVDFSRLGHPRRDMVWVALAGPGTNLILAVAAASAIPLAALAPDTLGQWLVYNLFNMVWINVLLAVFNMLPVPPLDGGRVAVGVLPRSLALPLARLEPYGFAIIIGGIFVLPFLGAQAGVDLNVFGTLVLVPAREISTVILALVGVQ